MQWLGTGARWLQDLQGEQEPEQRHQTAWHPPTGGILGLEGPSVPGREVIPQALGACPQPKGSKFSLGSRREQVSF